MDATTPELLQGQLHWWTGDRLVVPSGIDGEGFAHAFDTGSEQWTVLESVGTRDGCNVSRIGPGAWWIADGQELIALDSGSSYSIPACPALPDPDVAVWADDELLVWGGPGPDFDSNSTQGLIWAPSH